MQLFNNILGALIRELREIRHNRLYTSILIVVPFTMILFFVAMFYRGEITDLPIAVVDHSNTPMSRKLAKMVDSTPGVSIAYNAQSYAEAEREMMRGNILAVVYIDDDFEADIYSGTPTSVECYTLGTNISADGIIERDVQSAVMTFSAGISLNRLQTLGEGYDEVMVDITPINIHSNIVANPYLNYGYYLAPLFMFMGIVIITVVATTYALGRELRDATASEWLASANGSLIAGVVAKILPITAIMSLMVQLILLILIGAMGMECKGSYIFLGLSSVVFILAYQSIAIIIVSLTANLRLALSLGGGYAVMAFTFSGITFPVSAMYPAIQPLARVFPLGYFSDIFINQMMLGTPIHYDIKNFVALVLFTMLMAITWRRLDRVARNKSYWTRG